MRLLLAALIAARIGLGTAAACTTDPECSDGNACNGIETCQAGVCVAGTPLHCQDVNPCTVDSCDPVRGVCQYTALPDGASCSDGTICNGVEVCQGGLCKAGTPLDCSDGIACTTDTCDPVTGCQHAPTPDGGSCSDGNVCNGLETCLSGVCNPGSPPSCDDGNPCTLDGCVAPTGCVHIPVANGLPCPDGNLCNGAEKCQAGACVAGTPLNCNDNNPCTLDGCDPLAACTHVAAVDGTSCSDGKVCNGLEHCVAAVCTPGTPAADGTSCGDQDICNGAEQCQGGTCMPGVTMACNDGDACTLDTCTSPTGCAHSPIVCDDGDPVTTDSCDTSFGCRYDAPIPGRLLSLKANPKNPFASKLRLVVRDAPALATVPPSGGGSDPVQAGGSVRVASAAGGFDRTFPLPAAKWSYIGNPAKPLGYRYADPSQTAGPVTKLLVRSGGLAQVGGKGTGLQIALPGVPNPVSVHLSLGGTRYCLAFGGSTGFKVDRLYVAKNAPAPAGCQ